MNLTPRIGCGWIAGVSVAMLAVLAPAAVGSQQAASPEKGLAFEAATIKLAAPDAVRNRVMPSAPNRMNIPSMSLVWLVYTAYGDGGLNTAMRVTGGPDWANTTAFAVEGVASGNATPRQKRLMLQALLEERFASKVRIERSIQSRRDRKRAVARRKLSHEDHEAHEAHSALAVVVGR